MFEKLRGFLGRRSHPTPDEPRDVLALTPEEKAGIGTPDDPLHGYEVAIERHEAAIRADANVDPETAIKLYEQSVAEGFVGSHPYEALATLYERRRDPTAAIQATEAYIKLARSGRMPRGAQRSANRKLPEFEARAQRQRRLM